MRGALALLDSLRQSQLPRRLTGDSIAAVTMAKLRLLHRVLMKQLCCSIADEIDDSTDLIRLRTCYAVTYETGYGAYQQSTTSIQRRKHY